MKPIIGLAILTAALVGGFLLGVINAVIADTTPDWDDE